MFWQSEVAEQHSLEINMQTVADRPDAPTAIRTDREVSSIRQARHARPAIPASLEFRHETLHPAHDHRVGNRQPAFGHHLYQVPKNSI
jgi:hypothetical protein